MNKIYLITFNEFNYDQYDRFVVIADSKKEAIDILMKKYSNEVWDEIDWKSGYKIKEIKATKKGIVLDSYNAG